MAAEYPDWVMVHKKKGTYINKVGDKYYLYAAHSEYNKDTKRARRVCDGYLGRITQKDGFIPANKIVNVSPDVFEIGLSYVVLSSTPSIREGLKRSFPKYGNILYSCSVLSYIYDEYSKELFSHSYLCLVFPDLDFPDCFKKTHLTGIERGMRMIDDRLCDVFGEDLSRIRLLFPDVRLIKIKERYFLSEIPAAVAGLSKKYKIDWRNPLWQN